MLSINRCKKPIEQLTHFCGLYVTVIVDCGKIVCFSANPTVYSTIPNTLSFFPESEAKDQSDQKP